MKRVLIILGLLLVTAGIAFALYYMFFRPTAPVTEVPTEEPTGPTGPGGLIPSAPGTPTTGVGPGAVPPTIELPPGVSEVATGGVTVVTPISSVPTVGASVSTSGQLSYYDKVDQRFYRLGDDGTVSLLSSRKFFDVDKATFDPQGEKAIVEYPDGSNILYDFTTDQQVTLPRHWEDFGFNSSGSQLISKSVGIDPSNRFIVISNPDGSSARAIQEMGENQDKVIVDWSPNNSIVAMARTGNNLGVDRQEVYFIGQNHENFKSLVVEGLGFQPKWSPDGNKLLYSTASDMSDLKPSLWLVDANANTIGQNRKPLNIETWADKCTFSDTRTVYCAIPTELPRGAGLQPAVAEGIPDEIYRIDLSTGLRTRIAIPEGSHTIDQIMLTPDEDKLFFVDQGSGTLQQIKLK